MGWYVLHVLHVLFVINHPPSPLTPPPPHTHTHTHSLCPCPTTNADIQEQYALEFPLLKYKSRGVAAVYKAVPAAETQTQTQGSNSNSNSNSGGGSASATNLPGNGVAPPASNFVPVAVAVSTISPSQRNILQEEDTRDDFRCFRSIERFLCQPPLLLAQTLVEIPTNKQANLIERYWSLDNIGKHVWFWPLVKRV